jgi:HK97 family phage portal protein
MRWPWQRKAEPPEKRHDPYWEALMPWPAASGQPVTIGRVEGIAVAQVCITLIAETCASLPLKVYRRRDDGGREEAPDHPLARLLRQPNDFQTALEFREQMVAAMLTAGNGYARKVVDGRGVVVEVVPLPPETVNPIRLVNGRIAYDLTGPRGGRQRLLADEVLHFRWRSKDGIRGLSPVTIARETFGNAIAEVQYQGAMWRNSARPSAVLQHPSRLTPEATARVQASLDKFRGAELAGKVAILEEGMTLQQWSLSAKDTDFIAGRKLTNEDICRIFNVPPPVAHILDHATYSNIAEQLKSFTRLTIRPWLVRIEQTIHDGLLSDAGRRQFFAEHSVEGLLRADTKDRFDAYRVAREWGWMSPNEIRRFENLPPIADGDVYSAPLNMAPLGTAAAGNAADA